MRWDDSARSRLFYRDRNHQHAQLRHAVDHAGPLEGKAILDIGCGYGDLLGLLPPCGYVGVDVDDDVVEAARELWPGWWFDATDKVWEADVVFAIGTLQQCADIPASLDAWWRATRETLVVTTSVPEKLNDEQRDQIDEWFSGVEHEVFASADDFRSFVVRR